MNYKILKKIIDKLLAVLLLVLLSPILILITFIVFIQVKGNPYFIQERSLALNYKRFRIYKFKTLVENINLPAFNDSKILLKPEKKKYLIKIGKFLRKTGIDELPQLINILKGEMSFVGPRPLSIEDLSKIKKYYNDIYKQLEEIKIQPGITGFWQITKDNNGDVNYLSKSNLFYQQNSSFKLDFKILLKSFVIMLTASHKDSIVGYEAIKTDCRSSYLFYMQKAAIYIILVSCYFLF